MLEFDDVELRFRRSDQEAFLVIKQLNLIVETGQVVSLIGRSGCGKTTIVRLASGLLQPSKGKVLLDGKPPSPKSLRGQMAVLFQTPALLPWANIKKNVELPALLFGNEGLRQYSDEALNLVGLSGFESAMPGEISGGMQARTALARAILYKPRYLFMDEPFGQLDDLTRREMWGVLRRVLVENTASCVLVTHSIAEALVLSDRVVILADRPTSVIEIVESPFRKMSLRDVETDPLFARMHSQLQSNFIAI